MAGKIIRLGFMLGIPLILLFILVVKPAMKGTAGSLVEGDGLVVIEDRGMSITLDEAQRMVGYLEADHQKYLAQSPENLQEFLQAKMTQKVMAQEALDRGLNLKSLVEWELEESRRKILATSMIAEKRDNLVMPDMQQIAREYYITHEEELREGESIDVAHVLFRVSEDDGTELDAEKRALAELVLAEIQSGLSFEDAARQYSEEVATAQLGGDLGEFERGLLVPEFENAAFALKEKDAISGVVKTQFGYHIIKLLADVSPGVSPSFEELEERLVATETTNYLQRVLTQYAETFQTNETKTVYVPALEQLLETLQGEETE